MSTQLISSSDMVNSQAVHGYFVIRIVTIFCVIERWIVFIPTTHLVRPASRSRFAMGEVDVGLEGVSFVNGRRSTTSPTFSTRTIHWVPSTRVEERTTTGPRVTVARFGYLPIQTRRVVSVRKTLATDQQNND